MSNEEPFEESTEESNQTIATIKKILVWLIVIFVSVMLLLVVIFQPRFFTFVQQTILVNNDVISTIMIG